MAAHISERDLTEHKEQSRCTTCEEMTKYICIQCSSFICNRCSVHENNDEIRGWKAGTSVGYCFDCSVQVSTAAHEEVKKTISTMGTQKIRNKMNTLTDRFVQIMWFCV